MPKPPLAEVLGLSKTVPPVPATPTTFNPNAPMADKLASNVSVGLDRHAELLAMPFDPTNLKQMRLIADVATAAINAQVKVDENRLVAERNPEALERVLTAIMEYQAAEKAKALAAAPAHTAAAAVDTIFEEHPPAREGHSRDA
jgi:hypothetical protein